MGDSRVAKLRETGLPWRFVKSRIRFFFSEGGIETTSFLEIPIGEVKKGMFVHVQLGWWKHPYLCNSFLVKSEKQIEELKKYGFKSIKYDPEKSLNGEATSQPIVSANNIPAQEPASSNLQDSDPEIQAIAAKRMMRIQFLHQRRKNLIKWQQEYRTALNHLSNIMKAIETNKESAIESAQVLVKNVLDNLLQDLETILLLMNLKEEDSLTYSHSLNVCILSMILGKYLGFSESDLKELGMAGLFHDIGKLKIPKKVWTKKTPLTQAERQYLELHPKYAVQMLTGAENVSSRVLEAIYQHHEKCNGKGYPQGLAADHISHFAKIIAVVDSYDNLTNQSTQGRPFTPYEALSFIYARLQSDLWGDIIIAFIKSLGVYPPGTLVELSDKNLGMIITTDQDESTRPTLVLYDENIPREAPVIINLAEEEELNIVRSLHPSDVAPNVISYLQPGKMPGFLVGTLTASAPS